LHVHIDQHENDFEAFAMNQIEEWDDVGQLGCARLWPLQAEGGIDVAIGKHGRAGPIWRGRPQLDGDGVDTHATHLVELQRDLSGRADPAEPPPITVVPFNSQITACPVLLLYQRMSAKPSPLKSPVPTGAQPNVPEPGDPAPITVVPFISQITTC